MFSTRVRAQVSFVVRSGRVVWGRDLGDRRNAQLWAAVRSAALGGEAPAEPARALPESVWERVAQAPAERVERSGRGGTAKNCVRSRVF